MSIWLTEINELKKVHESVQGKLPGLEKELERLVATEDENMLLVYSRRCLEVIITDLCEHELKRHRGTEPLQRILDKLNKEEIVPHNIIVSMQNVNSMSTFGAHPKEFELKQVKPVLSNLETIIAWYIKYRGIKINKRLLKDIENQDSIGPEQQKSKRKGIIIIGAMVVVACVVTALIHFDVVEFSNQAKNKIIDSIVILPFDNFTGDDSLEYFVAGMHSSLIGDMQRLGGLRVIGTTSAKSYKNSDMPIPEIGKELDVGAVVETTVMCLGDSICLQIRLMSTYPEEKQLWVADYKEEKSQILNLYNRITKKIADEVEAKLTPGEEELLSTFKTVNTEAYDAYLKGLFYWDKLGDEALQEALRNFNKAVALDRVWALPYLGIANVWIGKMQMGFAEPTEAIPLIYININKALELDPNSAESYYTSGLIAGWTEWNWEKSEKDFKTALEINPNHALAHAYYAHILMILRRSGEALTQGQTALELDPLNPLVRLLYGIVLTDAGRFQEAIDIAEKVIAFDPENYFAYNVLETGAAGLGDYKKMLEGTRKLIPLPEEVYATILNIMDTEGQLAGCKKLAEEAEKWAENNFVLPVDLAFKYDLAKNKEKSLEWLEKAYEMHDPNLPYVTTGLGFNSMEDNPGFIDLLKRMNLPLKTESIKPNN